MTIKGQQRLPLVASAALQFVFDGLHLIIKAIVFGDIIFQERSVLCNAYVGKPID